MKQFRLYGAAAAVFALDRVSKLLWHAADRVVLPGVLALRGVRNDGLAFGLLPKAAGVLAFFSTLLLVAALLFLSRRAPGRGVQYGAGLMLGGALGNLLDRLLFGAVIDFIEPLFISFPVFNVADIGVTCGAALLALCLLTRKEEQKRE